MPVVNKRFAIMDGVMMSYEVQGAAIQVQDGLVVVYDSTGSVKIILNLAPGHSIMWVTDVVGLERTING